MPAETSNLIVPTMIVIIRSAKGIVGLDASPEQQRHRSSGAPSSSAKPHLTSIGFEAVGHVCFIAANASLEKEERDAIAATGSGSVGEVIK
jgi:hypothetical protein